MPAIIKSMSSPDISSSIAAVAINANRARSQTLPNNAITEIESNSATDQDDFVNIFTQLSRRSNANSLNTFNINITLDPQAIMQFNHHVLEKFMPNLDYIVDKACIAQVYNFTNALGWEETPVKGPLFIVRLDALPYQGNMRYAAFIMNRGNLGNWVCHISESISVVENDDYIILANPAHVPDAYDCVMGSEADEMPDCWGLWVYAEPNTTVAREKRRILSNLENAKTFAEAMATAEWHNTMDRMAGINQNPEPWDEAAEFLKWMETPEGEEDPNCPY